MATIQTTTTIDSHGNVTVERRVLSPVQVKSRRGALQSKTIKAYQEGRGRRSHSPYANRARGSGQGVLPSNESILTRSIDIGHRVPVTPRGPLPPAQYNPEGDKGRQYEKQIRDAKKIAQGR
jgi:hypothetical protein